MVLIEQGNTWSRITGLTQEMVADIDRVTSYPTPAAQTGTWQPPEAVMLCMRRGRFFKAEELFNRARRESP